jgi:hypothetical protein
MSQRLPIPASPAFVFWEHGSATVRAVVSVAGGHLRGFHDAARHEAGLAAR